MKNLDNQDNLPYPNYNEMPMSPNYHEMPTSPNHDEFLMSPNPNDYPTPDPPPPWSAPSLPPEITCVFHPMINGKLSSLSLDIYYLINTGTPCDENREPLPNGTPPPHQDTDNGPNDWFLYGSWAEFELCDLLYRKSKMPAGQVDELLNIIAAMQAMSGGELLSHHIRTYMTPLMWQS